MKRLLLLAVPALLAAQCAPEPDPVEPPTGPVYDLGEPVSVKADLKMKRWRQIHLDLQGALELRPDAVCNETGIYDCRILHNVPLGGINIENGLFRPVEGLAVASGLAIERFVLSACAERAAQDAEAEEPLIFTMDLDGTTLEREEADAFVTDLYRRLLARDPLPEELDAVFAMHAGIVADGGLNMEWGWMACFAIGTSTEALLY